MIGLIYSNIVLCVNIGNVNQETFSLKVFSPFKKVKHYTQKSAELPIGSAKKRKGNGNIYINSSFVSNIVNNILWQGVIRCLKIYFILGYLRA